MDKMVVDKYLPFESGEIPGGILYAFLSMPKEATFLAHCKQSRLKATLWRAAHVAMPLRRVRLLATRLAYHEQ
jgi:hypothetical protein